MVNVQFVKFQLLTLNYVSEGDQQTDGEAENRVDQPRFVRWASLDGDG